MEFNNSCCEVSKSRIVSCTENKKRFSISNPNSKSIRKCIVDGQWIKGSRVRCDFLFTIDEETLYLVELKGTDHVHALEQLVSTAEHLKTNTFKGDVKSVIVGSPCPKASTNYQKAMKKLMPRFKKIGLSMPQKKNGSLEVIA